MGCRFPKQDIRFPDGWDTVGDKVYDEHLIELFKGMRKRDYEDLISFSYADKSYLVLKRVEELLEESLKVCLTHRGY